MPDARLETRDFVERRFDPGQPRVTSGEHGGEWTARPGLRDVLKLAGKIGLEPGEELLASGKVDGDGGAARLALTGKGDARSLRLGLGGPGFGSRDDEAGPWRGSRDRTAALNAERKKLSDEHDSIEAELDRLNTDPGADPARRAELQSRYDELEDMDLDYEVSPAGYTAKLGRPATEQLRSTLSDALDKGAKAQAERDADWDERDRLEKERDKLRFIGRKWTDEEDARWDDLIARLEALEAVEAARGYQVFAEGSVPGEWADVHYQVYLDDPAVGVEVRLGAVPHGSGRDLGDLSGDEQVAMFDPSEARKLLRLLGQYAGGEVGRSHEVSRMYAAPDGGPVAQGSGPKGGQFALGGGRVSAKGRTKPRRRAPAMPRKPAGPPKPLGFNGKSGTGYGVKGGDARVRTLQSVLNRFGLTDSSGRALVVDGKYGPRTTAAVKKLQKAMGLEATGTADEAFLKRVSSARSLAELKTSKPARKARVRRSKVAEHVLDNGICVTCSEVSRAGSEHVFDNGVCVTCEDDEALDEDSLALLAVLNEYDKATRARRPKLSGAALAEFNLKHPRGPGGKFRSTADRVREALDAHFAGGKDDPFEGFRREQLRRVAKALGVKLGHGEGRDSIAEKLLDSLGEGRKPAKKATPKPTKFQARQERQRRIDAVRPIAEHAAEVQELADNTDDLDVLRERVETRGAAPELIQAVRDAKTVDEAAEAAARIAEQAGLKRVGRAGHADVMDRRTMKPVDGSVPDGAPVTVVRPGYRYDPGDGEVSLVDAVVVTRESAPVPKRPDRASGAAKPDAPSKKAAQPNRADRLAGVDTEGMRVVKTKSGWAVAGGEPYYLKETKTKREAEDWVLWSLEVRKRNREEEQRLNRVDVEELKPGDRFRTNPSGMPLTVDRVESLGPDGGRMVHTKEVTPAGDRFLLAGSQGSDAGKVFRVQPEPMDTGGRDSGVEALTKRVPRPVADSAKPYHRNVDGIEDLARAVEDGQPLRHRARLTGGVSADTELHILKDGTKVVYKYGGQPEAEHAASMIARALGLDAPRVYRNHPSAVYMDHVDNAKTWDQIRDAAGETMGGDLAARYKAIRNSDDAKLVGLLDLMIVNGDRNGGNWMIDDSGRVVPIDHGHAFWTNYVGMPGSRIRAHAIDSTFSGAYLAGPRRWGPNDLTADDIAEVRSRLEKLRPDFKYIHRERWLSYAFAVLDAVEPWALGSRSLIAGVR